MVLLASRFHTVLISPGRQALGLGISVFQTRIPKRVFGWRGGNNYLGFLYRVEELQLSGVQVNASVRIGPWKSVFQISFYGTSNHFQLGADLMVPASFQLDFQKVIAIQGF